MFARALRTVALAIVASLMGLAAVGGLYKPNVAIPGGFLGTHVTLDGVPIRVAQSGEGRDVLLIHGSPGSIEDWEPVTSALSGSFRVTAFDRPGHGYSGDNGQYSYAYNADVALALIDELKLDHVVVAGHSYGGTTALAMALRDSPRIDAFVVVDSGVYSSSRKGGFLYKVLRVPVIGMGFGSVFTPLVAPKKIRAGLRELFSGGNVPEDFVTRRIAIWNTPKVAHATAVETLGADVELQSLSRNYSHIKRPVWIVAEADSQFRRATAERLHGDILGSCLRLVSGTGHFIQFEKTGEVVAAIREAAGVGATGACP